MIINYNDPRFQQMLMRRAGANPWGGVRTNTGPETAAWTKDQMGMGLQLSEAAMAQKMNQARIAQMLFNQAMAQKQFGLKEKYFGLDEGMFGLDTQRFGLAERGMGLKEQQMGLREQGQGLDFDRSRWQYKTGKKDVSDKMSALNLSTALGLGTAAWSAYEGNRRRRIQEADAEANKQFMARIFKQK